MPEYYTYKRDVPLRPGERLGFTRSRGYYPIPAPKAAPPPASSKSAPGGSAQKHPVQPKPSVTSARSPQHGPANRHPAQATHAASSHPGQRGKTHPFQPTPASTRPPQSASRGGGVLGGLEHVGSEFARGLVKASQAAHAAIDTSTHVVVNVVAVLPYAEYYGAYETARGINALGANGGEAGSVVSHILASPLTVLEAHGLLGDAWIDLLKGEPIRDEQVRGYINPLHSFLSRRLRGPRTYLPGIGERGIDFQW
ncbi:MAG TPA: hypothetical protein VFL66_03180 [Gaiellaceae bacterium]|nr:hypothetical protein [Gaiellaceae bacterium]